MYCQELMSGKSWGDPSFVISFARGFSRCFFASCGSAGLEIYHCCYLPHVVASCRRRFRTLWFSFLRSLPCINKSQLVRFAALLWKLRGSLSWRRAAYKSIVLPVKSFARAILSFLLNASSAATLNYLSRLVRFYASAGVSGRSFAR